MDKGLPPFVVIEIISREIPRETEKEVRISQTLCMEQILRKQESIKAPRRVLNRRF